MMKWWMDLGAVDTIYEDDQEEDETPCSSPPVSATVFLCLHIKVDARSRATGLEPDLLVHVQDRCFHLHKEPLLSCSGYLRRRLDPSNNSVTVPSTVTAETFAAVAAFCYDPDILITPFNLVPLRMAAEILDLAEVDEDNLLEKTDNFFSRVVVCNAEIAETVLRSCLRLMPEAEEAAFMAGRCIDALMNLTEKGNEVSDGWIDAVKRMKLEEMFLILDSMRPAKFHDNLYKLVTLYLKANNSALTSEEKNKITEYVECKKLSQPALVHAVKNPNMPLRMVVQAMLVEQFNTRVSFFSATEATRNAAVVSKDSKGVTLEGIMERDAALRHVDRLKTSIAATNERIMSLERDLMDMKEKLRESEKSGSCRFSWEEKKRSVGDNTCDIEKGCRVSFLKGKSLGRVLLNGVKKVFRTSKSKKGAHETKNETEREIGVPEKATSSHVRSQSFG